jgi:hypothetical protein
MLTSLPTICKTITSIVSKRIKTYTDDRNVMPKEQKGCCGRSIGCKVQLLISKAILQECKSKKKKMYAWNG